MNIRVLGAHNCESKDSRCVSLLIDDVIALDAGALTDSLSFRDQRKLKAVLLTHQHYDHIKDIPTLGMSLYLQKATVDVYFILPVYEALTTHLLNAQLYPRFYEKPPENPTLKFHIMEPYQTAQIEGYSVLAVPVNHSVPVAGYQITSPEGKVVFYTGDMGPGLTRSWESVSPQLLIIEVTASDRFEAFGRESMHLTPLLLKEELLTFRELKGYLPRVLAIHMNPFIEKEIETEIAALAEELKTPIALAHEGMQLHL